MRIEDVQRILTGRNARRIHFDRELCALTVKYRGQLESMVGANRARPPVSFFFKRILNPHRGDGGSARD